MKSIITLGGKGTRLKELTGETPKPLFPILGQSPLERISSFLKKNKILDSIWICGYKSQDFKKYASFIEKKYKLNIEILVENEALGECGKLKEKLLEKKEQYIFLSGDIIFNINLKKAIDFHNYNSSQLTLFTHTSTHAHDSDCIIESPQKNIFDYKLKTDKTHKEGSFLGNSGIYIFNGENFNKAIREINQKQISVFREVFPKFIEMGFRVMSYNTSEYIHDIGTKKRFKNSEEEIKKNILEKKCYDNQQSCLFLDRDGTLIECSEGEYITHKDQIRLKEDKILKLKKIAKDFDTVEIITNQPVVSMKKIKEQDLIILNGILVNMCLRLGLKIDQIRYCPHHPHSGFPNEIKSLKRYCFCRKPKPGLLLEAIYEKNVSTENSLFIGDTWRDKLVAQSVGIKYQDITSL